MIFTRHILLAQAAILALLLVSCSSVQIGVTVPMPGEFRLTDVSRIAIADFDSLPNDPLRAQAAADPSLCALVQRLVAASFSQSKLYTVVDLKTENAVAREHHTAPAARFDAVLYGRVWWMLSGEYDGSYPQKLSVSSWQDVPYWTRGMFGEPIQLMTPLLSNQHDELVQFLYRSRRACLMLQLTLYHVDYQGLLHDPVTVFSASAVTAQINNGDFAMRFTPIGPAAETAAGRLAAASRLYHSSGVFTKTASGVDVTGQTRLTQKTGALPSPIQTQLLLGAQVTQELARRLAPSATTFLIDCEFKDAKLQKLFQHQAYLAARRHLLNGFQQHLDPAMLAQLAPVASEIGLANAAAPLPPEQLQPIVLDHAEDFFALGLCEETAGRFKDALFTYRFLFQYQADARTALGISRCLFALGQRDQLQTRLWDASDAARKSGLK